MMKMMKMNSGSAMCARRHRFRVGAHGSRRFFDTNVNHIKCSTRLMSKLYSVSQEVFKKVVLKWSLIDTGVMDDALPSSPNYKEKKESDRRRIFVLTVSSHAFLSWWPFLPSSQRKPSADVSPVPPPKQQPPKLANIGRQTADRHSHLTTHLMECKGSCLETSK